MSFTVSGKSTIKPEEEKPAKEHDQKIQTF